MLHPADPAFVEHLAAGLPPDTLQSPQPRYLEDPRGRWQGRAGAVALPRTTAEVAQIVRACGQAGVGIVPWGGGTGLVCGFDPDIAQLRPKIKRIQGCRCCQHSHRA